MLIKAGRIWLTTSNSRSKVCVKYAGPMELWHDALVTTCEGQSRRRLSPLRLSANTAMLRTACFLCVIGHRELLYRRQVLISQVSVTNQRKAGSAFAKEVPVRSSEPLRMSYQTENVFAS